MKIQKMILTSIALFNLSAASTPASTANDLAAETVCESVLLRPSNFEYGLPLFHLYRFDEILPSLKVAIQKFEVEWKAIRDNKEEPTFQNTIVPMEFLGEDLDRVLNYVYAQKATELTPELSKILDKAQPAVQSAYFEFGISKKLFSRVKKVYDKRDQLRLNREERRLLENAYRAFIERGVGLSEASQRELKAMSIREEQLGLQFTKNNHEDEATFAFVVSDESRLKGIPADAIEQAKENAKNKGLSDAWVFLKLDDTLSLLFDYADDSTLRREAYQKAYIDSGKNSPLILEIVKLRQREAVLRGFTDYAHYRTSTLMAESPERVHALLDRLLEKAKPGAQIEFAELLEYVQSKTGSRIVNAWDISYWVTKMQAELLSYDDEAMREYFPLDQVLSGLFKFLKQTYNISFHERTDIPKLHPDMRTYEIWDDETKKPLAVLYLDPFKRARKAPGAHMSTLRARSVKDGREKIAIVRILTNFRNPQKSSPALISIDDVKTVFHEFGHAVQQIFSKNRFPSLTSMVWDAVELPSQFMEGFAEQPEVLAMISRPNKAGKSIDENDIASIKRYKGFQAGWKLMMSARSAKLDQAWHTKEGAEATDVEAFEKEAILPFSLIPPPPGRIISNSFAHVFTGAYSAAYYSYIWAEVLSADVNAAYMEPGLFTKEYRAVARRFREKVLARADAVPMLEAFKDFRGREPDIEFLLRDNGLIK